MGLAAINWHSFFFLLFAVLTCGFALAVLFSSNIVRMAFFLIVSLTGTAGLFFLAGAHFVGAMQIMIYVGGTLVLLIFGVMLTARATFVSMQTRAGEWVLAVIVGGCLLLVLLQAAVSIESWRRPVLDQSSLVTADAQTSTPLGLGLMGVRVDRLSQPDERLRQGMSGYLLPFEVVSIHLLVVLVGAAYLRGPSGACRGPTGRSPQA